MRLYFLFLILLVVFSSFPAHANDLNKIMSFEAYSRTSEAKAVNVDKPKQPETKSPREDYRFFFGNGNRAAISSDFPTETNGKQLQYWEIGLFKDVAKVSEYDAVAHGLSLMLARDSSNSAFQKIGIGWSWGYYLFLTVFHLRGSLWAFNTQDVGQNYNSLATELNLSLPLILLGQLSLAGINGGIGYEVAGISGIKTNFYSKLGITVGLGTALFH